MLASSTAERVDALLARSSQRSDLPAAGRIVGELQAVVRSETAAALDVVRLILQDPGLSSKVLRVVNSAFYRPGGDPISTVTRAVLVLGFETIRDVATGLVLIEAVLGSGGPRAYLREALQRSLHRGLLARELSLRVGYPEAEEAYLLGLFADWGMLWTAAWLPAEFERAVEHQRARGGRLEDAVREVLGVPPGELAATVLQRWNFPAVFADYFRLPPPARPARGSSADRLLAVVHVAAEATTPCPEDPAAPMRRARERFQALFDLGPEPFAAATAVARETFREQSALYGLGPVTEEPPDALPTPRPRLGAPSGTTAPAAAGPTADAEAVVAIVAETSRAILERLDINDILAMAIEGVARAGGFDVVCLFLVTPGRDALHARLGVGEGVKAVLGDLRLPLAPAGGIVAEAVLDGQPQSIADGIPMPQLPMVRSFIAYPVVVRGRPVGVLLAGRRHAGREAVSDGELVGLFATQAALALDRSAR